MSRLASGALILMFTLVVAACGGDNGGGGAIVPGGEVKAPGSVAATKEEKLRPGVGKMGEPRLNHSATVLKDGRVLVAGSAGGFDGSSRRAPLPGAELFDPDAGAWSLTADMERDRESHGALLLPDGSVMVIAGRGGNLLPGVHRDIRPGCRYLDFGSRVVGSSLRPHGDAAAGRQDTGGGRQGRHVPGLGGAVRPWD